MSGNVPPYSSTRLTAHIGLVLTVMLALMFASGAFFFLYVFNFNVPPWFTAVRVVHFYTGLASIPFLLAKYGTTSFRLAGYYLRVPRFRAAGPPSLVPRLLSPLLAADFFVLYFSGLYMLFHYYYTTANIWPFEAKPVQLHLAAARSVRRSSPSTSSGTWPRHCVLRAGRMRRSQPWCRTRKRPPAA